MSTPEEKNISKESDQTILSTNSAPVDHVERSGAPRRPISLQDPRLLSGPPCDLQELQNTLAGTSKRNTANDRSSWRPRCVEEALSSMLWQPYDIGASSGSDDDNSDKLYSQWDATGIAVISGNIKNPKIRHSAGASFPQYSMPHSFTDNFVKYNRFSDDFSNYYHTKYDNDPSKTYPLLSPPAYTHVAPEHHQNHNNKNINTFGTATSSTDDFVSRSRGNIGDPHSQATVVVGAKALPGLLTRVSHPGGEKYNQSQLTNQSRGTWNTSMVHGENASTALASASASRLGNGLSASAELEHRFSLCCDSECSDINVIKSVNASYNELKTSLNKDGRCVRSVSVGPVSADVRGQSSCEITSNCFDSDKRTVDSMRVNVPAPPQGFSSGQDTINVSKVTANVTPLGSLIPVNTNPSSEGINIVNCYRAIPVNVVSNVPSIPCRNQDTVNTNSVHVATVNSNSNGVQIVNNAGVELITRSCSEFNNSDRSEIVSANNICNVRVVSMPVTQQASTSVSPQPRNIHNAMSQSTPNFLKPNLVPPVPRDDVVQMHQTRERADTAPQRTFTSTEAQTDDNMTHTDSTQEAPTQQTDATQSLISREERRRERRERRHNRRLITTGHLHNPSIPFPPPPNPSQFTAPGPRSAYGSGAMHPAVIHPAPPGHINYRPDVEILPDILHSHVPPAYSTLPIGAHVVGPPPGPIVGLGGPMPGPEDMRYGFPVGLRRSVSEPRGKGCCGLGGTRPPLRALIAVVALGGVACALGGAALGALGLGGPPTSHLTAALLMIGVGVILVTISGAAWRLTAPGSPTCRALLGLGSGTTDSAENGCNRRFSPRTAAPCGRASHPYGAMMYPEFQHRQPPPSYQASMQEYRLRLLLLDRHSINARGQQGASPPPTYRSHAGSLLRAPLSSRCPAPGSEYSLPPSYRSRQTQSRPAPSLHDANIQDLNQTDSPGNEENVTDSQLDHPSTDIVDSLSNLEEIDAIKICPDSGIVPLRMLLKNSNEMEHNNESTKDRNLVTIVQTGDESSPVIVTVSGCSALDQDNDITQSEMEILAHL